MKLLIKGKNMGVRVLEFKDKKTSSPYNVYYVSLYQPGEKPTEMKCLPAIAKELKDLEDYVFELSSKEYEGKTYYKIVGLEK